MKLISKFKDYYDFIAHRYHDEKVVYDRTTIRNLKIPYKDVEGMRGLPRGIDDPKGGLSRFRYLIINGCYYLLVGDILYPTDTFELLNMEKHKHLEKHLFRTGWFFKKNALKISKQYKYL